MTRLIRAYFLQTRRYGTRRFIIEMALIPFPFKLLVGMLAAIVLTGPVVTNTEAILEGSLLGALALAIVAAPLTETLIGQWFPLFVSGFFTRSAVFRVVVSAIFFSSLHLPDGPVIALAVLPVAVVLAAVFLLQRARSWWRAYLVTAAVHALHNALSLAAFLLAA